MVTFIQGGALAPSCPRGELLSCYLLSLEILSDWKDILLSNPIDTLAHSWPRGELLLAAFSTSVIYPQRCCQQGFTKWTPDLQFSSFLVFFVGSELRSYLYKKV